MPHQLRSPALRVVFSARDTKGNKSTALSTGAKLVRISVR
jgi:hypothetical protein